jgi:hypothetical protein
MVQGKSKMEDDVIFTDPHGKRKLDEHLNTSLSQFHCRLKKHRFVGVGISEIESLQQKHLPLLPGAVSSDLGPGAS